MRTMLGFPAAKPLANPATKSREQNKRLTPTTIGGRLVTGKNLLTIDVRLSSDGRPGRSWAGVRVT